MKFLFRSGWGESLAIARRVADEGHEVLLSIHPEGREALHVGDGLVDKTRDFEKALGWADVVVFDGNTFDLPKEAERIRNKISTLGSSAFSDKLEHDRPFAISLVEKANLLVPDFKVFKGAKAFEQARLYLESEEQEGWVFKPDRDVPIRTHVADSTDEMLRMLEYFEHRFEEEKAVPDFLLEERVEGILVSTECWWTGKEFVCPNSTLEKNRLFNEDLGEMTGCAGNVIWAYPDLSVPLVQKLLTPLAGLLGDRYRGPLDVNAIVGEDGDPYFLEFSPRFGYSAIFGFLELVEDVGGLLSAVGRGEAPKGKAVPRTDVFAIGVRATIPPYPAEVRNMARGYPVFGFDPEVVDRHVNPCEIALTENDEPITTGPDGIVFEFSNTGSTIGEARKHVYETIEGVQVPNMRYRTDIGDEEEEERFAKLAQMGLLGIKNKNWWEV